jgi:hypothetical protein
VKKDNQWRMQEHVADEGSEIERGIYTLFRRHR